MSEEKKPAALPSEPEEHDPFATIPLATDLTRKRLAAAAAASVPAVPAPTPEPTPAAVPAEAPPAPAIPPAPAAAAPAAAVPATPPAIAPAEVKPIDWKQTPRLALVVDDEPANRDFLVRLLEQAKFQVKGASSALEAMKYASEIQEGMCVIAIDNLLPDMGGVELLTKLRPIYPAARIVMATMLDERSLMAKAFENGCDVFLVKPHGFMELFRRLQMAVTSGEDDLKRLIIDQYGPRPYRG
jgi:CheY-like chemotaxis protein